MTGAEDRYADIEVDVLDDAGFRTLIDNALARAGCTWEELQEQAKAGSFSTEIAQRAWFVVSSFALTEVGETIPCSAAFLDTPRVQTPTSTRLSESVAERYGLTTP